MEDEIEGLERVVTARAAHSVEAFFSPVGEDGSRRLRVERLSSGTTHVEYLENGAQPKVDPTEEMFVNEDDPALVDRIVRAMAVRHLGVDEAASNLTGLDLEMLSRGFTLGSSETGSAVWIRLASPMTVVFQRREEDGIPRSFDDEVSAICLIPGRRHVRFICGNVRSALMVVDTNMAYEVDETKNEDLEPDEMVTIPFFLDRKSVVIH